MDRIKSILDFINSNGCSDQHITELTQLCKNILKDKFQCSTQNLSILNSILTLPLFSKDGHRLFDIVLSGLLMHDNSDLLWAKWIYNRMLMHELEQDRSLFYKDPVEYIENNKDIGVRALYELRNIMVPAYVDTMDDIVDIRYKFQRSLIWLNQTFDEWKYSYLLYPIQLIPVFSKTPGYYLTYHDCNNAMLLREQSTLYSNLLKLLYGIDSLEYVGEPNKDNDRLKVGFVSRSLKNHSVGKISVGLIEQFAKNNIDVYVYTLDNREEVIGKRIYQSCHKYINPGAPLTDWLESIKKDRLDVLIILDPIMDINMYLIGCFRVAPVQISTWGHPDTTGLPYIDYYVSSRLFEKHNDCYHTERLVRFNSSSICYNHINEYLGFNAFNVLKATGKENIRKIYGIPETAHVYGITSPMFKIYPVMDKVIDAILNRDPRGVVVMLMGQDDTMLNKVSKRLKKNVTNFDRILFAPHQYDVLGYLQFVYSLDVVLDTFPFGGCISTLETFMLGVGIVTLPGNKLYGRFTQGFYKIMDMDDLIAKDVDDYIQIAVKMACNASYRTLIENKIMANNHKLFDDAESVKEWVEFLRAVK